MREFRADGGDFTGSICLKRDRCDTLSATKPDSMNPALFLLHLTGGRFGYIVVCVLLGTWLQAAEKPVIRGKPIKSVTPTSKEASRNVIATNAVARPADISTTNSALTVVGFELLSAFKYEVPEEGSAGAVPKSTAVPAVDPDGQIPAQVKAFNGRRVALKGFMLPLKVEGGLVTELLLMRDQSMCCFGTVPKINEWVAVKMTGTGVKPVMDQAVTLSGTIKIGAMRENGYLVGIYQMDGERLDGALGAP